jgi:cell division protein FtsB
MTDKNIWYLPGPFHRYEDDVKAIAKKAGLRIVDANVTESRDGECERSPKVKLKELPAPAEMVVEVSLSQVEAELKDAIDKLNAERDGLRGLIESLEGASPLEHPGAGELPIRLFDALTKIHAGVTDLAGSRDQIANERNALQAEVDALKKVAEQPAKDKAKPDAKA